MASSSSYYGSFKHSLKDLLAVCNLSKQDKLNSTSVNALQQRNTYWLRVRKIRKPHLKGVVIVLIWSFLVWGVLWHSFSEVSLSRTGNQKTSKFKFEQKLSYILANYVIVLLVFFVGTPLSGWLADAYIGRYKVLVWSLWLLFSGVIIRHTTNLVHIYGFSSEDDVSVISVFLLIFHCIGSVLLWSGAFGFLSNSIQFGVDQMPDASANEISTFIFWYAFALNLGIWSMKCLSNLVQNCSDNLGDVEVIIQTIIPVLLIAIGLSLNYLLKNVLTIEPQTRNPFKLIFGVIKHAVTHKKPRIRSALTYLDEPPSRLDLGKYKFGGPFTTEQVEDVKTFLRILFLMWSTILIVIAYSLVVALIDLTPQSIAFSVCRHTVIELFVYDHSLLIVVGILLYEFVIYPLVQRNMMRMLRRIVAAAFILCFVIVFLSIVDLGRHAVHHRYVCTYNNTALVPISDFLSPVALYSVEAVGNILLSVTVAILSTATFEFVYAQSPYSMRGIMMGLTWFVFSLSLALGGGILKVWNSNWPWHYCNIMIYVVCFTISFFGLVFFGITAFCYKNRVRDDIRNETAVIEEVYARRCAIEDSQMTNNDNVLHSVQH